jgi:hypothetical protein
MAQRHDTPIDHDWILVAIGALIVAVAQAFL